MLDLKLCDAISSFLPDKINSRVTKSDAHAVKLMTRMAAILVVILGFSIYFHNDVHRSVPRSVDARSILFDSHLSPSQQFLQLTSRIVMFQVLA